MCYSRHMETPTHYNLSPAPIDVIEAWSLNFALGNALKYIARARLKGDYTGDLLKAIDYLRREVGEQEKRAKQTNDQLDFDFSSRLGSD